MVVLEINQEPPTEYATAPSSPYYQRASSVSLCCPSPDRTEVITAAYSRHDPSVKTTPHAKVQHDSDLIEPPISRFGMTNSKRAGKIDTFFVIARWPLNFSVISISGLQYYNV